jgi:putative transposase
VGVMWDNGCKFNVTPPHTDDDRTHFKSKKGEKEQMGRGNYHPDRYTRRNLRLPKHDYTWTGAYFVTIRAAQYEPVLDIPKLRSIVVEAWQALPARFPGVALDEFIVMPDHLHFILWLDGTRENAPHLGDVVGAYKSLTIVAWYRHLKSLGQTWPGFLWQRDYFEHVIRDPTELEQKRLYIRTNPIRQKQKDANRREKR